MWAISSLITPIIGSIIDKYKRRSYFVINNNHI